MLFALHTFKRQIYSGALAAQQSPHPHIGKKGNPQIDFFMVIMVGGSIAHEHKCTTAATESLKMAAILQIIGRQRHAVLVYQVFL